ncbi:hypothetical protein C1I89_22335 [Achromobacter pulmonis]|uniref:Uncharacterized protein n=1 Tax=Achromobacter pulmonis TaxID=1389932 RepID=A0A2N8KDQ7_9BURK|nr:hypothetical protein [Achromobacter pulmonis]PND31579.1 hypothetical protein C1I89_22335 [Achromobacter pulmonis]
MRSLEETTVWQRSAIGELRPLESEEGATDRPTRAAIPLIVEIRATAGWVVTVPDWFFNGIPDVSREAADRPLEKPDEKVQIGPLDV